MSIVYHSRRGLDKALSPINFTQTFSETLETYAATPVNGNHITEFIRQPITDLSHWLFLALFYISVSMSTRGGDYRGDEGGHVCRHFGWGAQR